MFFPELITRINESDRVLEIGPGNTPYHRSDVLLEKKFEHEEHKAQSGYVQDIKLDPRTVFYEGDFFPFKDNEFDYVICSHVIEHVANIPHFISELTRVAKRGYIEFPLPMYEFQFDFPVHVQFVAARDSTIFWLPKSETTLEEFRPLTKLNHALLAAGYDSTIKSMPSLFIQGFEWEGHLNEQRCSSISELQTVCPIPKLIPYSESQEARFREMLQRKLEVTERNLTVSEEQLASVTSALQKAEAELRFFRSHPLKLIKKLLWKMFKVLMGTTARR